VKGNINLSPGQRHKLACLGVSRRRIGKAYNKAGTLPKPKNDSELAEMIADPTRAKEIMATPEALTKFITDYAHDQQGDGTDLKRLVSEETQRQVAQMLKENEQPNGKDDIKRLNLDPQNRPSGMISSHKQATAHNPRADGAVLDNHFNSFQDFIRTTWHRNPSPEAAAKVAEIRNASSSVVPSDGGFLVPEVFRSQLLQLSLETSVVRPRATVVPMEAPRVPFPMIDSTTNSGSVYGGMIAYWGEESTAFTESQPKFGRVTLDAKKLTGFALVPNELLKDSFTSFSALLEGLWPQALAFFEDVAYMSGTGVGEPLGFLGAGNAAGIAVTKETSQTASTIVLENIIKMYSRMLPASLNRAVWIVSPDCIPELYTMSISVGTGGAPVMLVNASGAGPATMLGRPIIISEKAGTLGSRSDVSFVDLNYYLIGDRQAMSMDQSTEYRFAHDQTAFRILQRVDGRPWLQSAITPANGGNSLSPFVEIAARA
jgi:HK97 family phage major capsid protein